MKAGHRLEARDVVPGGRAAGYLYFLSGGKIMRMLKGKSPEVVKSVDVKIDGKRIYFIAAATDDVLKPGHKLHLYSAPRKGA